MHLTHKAISRSIPALLLGGVVVGLPAAVPAADTPPLLGPASREEMTALVRALGDSDYQARMFATRRLCAIGMEAWELLRATAESSDAEAALRARQLLSVFDRLWFSGADVSLAFSKPIIDWLESVDLDITMTNRLPFPARVPFETDADARRESGDARQVADMLDLAEWLKVRAPDGRELELRVDDIGGDPAVFAVVQSRLAGGPGGALAPGSQVTLTVRAFNRGWARFPLLDRGEYTIMLDYVPDWTDEALAAARAGRVVSAPAAVTVREGAPPTVSRSGIRAELIVGRESDAVVARLVNRTDQPLSVNTHFGGGPPFAEGRWVYQLDQACREVPVSQKPGASWHDFKPELLVEIPPGESIELSRSVLIDLQTSLSTAGADLSGDRWSLHFEYANLCDRHWQMRQGAALLGNQNAPPFFQRPIPLRILAERHSSNRLTAASLQ